MNQMNKDDKKFMQIALEEAKKSDKDVPVGALIVLDGEIISREHNKKELNSNPVAHAEILAIQEASSKLGRWRLDGAEIFVTLEPCPMCAAAILFSRVSRVVFGAYDSLYGAFGSVINMSEILKTSSSQASPEVKGGMLEKECSEILKAFFQGRR